MEAFFDALARGLATSLTRRQAVQIALGTIAGVMLPLPAAAAGCNCGSGLICCQCNKNGDCAVCLEPGDTCCKAAGLSWGCSLGQPLCCGPIGSGGGCCGLAEDCCPGSGTYDCCDTLVGLNGAGGFFCTGQPPKCCGLISICVAKKGKGASICCHDYPQICARECPTGSSPLEFVSEGAPRWFSTAQTAFTVLYNFTNSPDGANPNAGLIQGPNGTLYGTTTNGGASNAGTIFRVASDGTSYTVLHSFTGTDGAGPEAGLMLGSDGNFYGTTNGGSLNQGNIFRMAPDGSGFTVLYNFSGSDGANPTAGLILGSDGNLYGTTPQGGSANLGVVFRIAPDGTGFAVLHNFTSGTTDGANPEAGVIQGADGMIYGTTMSGGGSGNFGTVFKMALDGSGFKLLHKFNGSSHDGANPYGSLIQGMDQMLYGTTLRGGSKKLGTVFRISTAGTGFAILHSFLGNKSADGRGPHAGLIQGPDGTLYGTTSTGGTSRVVGTVFQMAPDGTGYTILHIFDVIPSDGAVPIGGLMRAADGTLYGTTSLGGASGFGTVFQL